jgi:hypothetical protein
MASIIKGAVMRWPLHTLLKSARTSWPFRNNSYTHPAVQLLAAVNEARPPLRVSLPTKWAAIVCTLVVLISGSVEAAHFHSLASKTPPVHCSICILGHSNRSAAPACVFEFARPVLRATAFLTPTALVAKIRIDCFARYVRPPPSA